MSTKRDPVIDAVIGMGAAAAGYAVSYFFSKKKEKKIRADAHKEGEQKAQAKHAIETEKLKSQIKNMLSKIEYREQLPLRPLQ